MIGKDALLAQENRMRPQARALFDAVGASGCVEPVTGAAGTTTTADDECSPTKSSAKLEEFALIASDTGRE
jgi:hypothetical protein